MSSDAEKITAVAQKYKRNYLRLSKEVARVKDDYAALSRLYEGPNIECMEELMPPAASEILKGQVKNYPRKSEGYRWTIRQKCLALVSLKEAVKRTLFSGASSCCLAKAPLTYSYRTFP